MERKDFLKQACGIGLCSCTVASLFASTTAHAADAPSPPKPEDGRIAFAQQRYNRLITALAARTDPKTVDAELKESVLRGGKRCAFEIRARPA